MNRIKILFISHSSKIAGGELSLLTLLKYLNKDLFEPVVVLPSKGPLQDEIMKLGIRIHFSPHDWWIRGGVRRNKSNIHANVHKITTIIDKERPDIVHTNTSVVLEGAIAAKRKNLIHIWHIHEILEEHPNLRSLFPLPLVYWIMDLLSDKVISVSNSVKTHLASIMSDEKLVTIYNGIEEEKVTLEEENSIRTNFSISNNEFIAVTVGSIKTEKGYENLLNAISLVKRETRNIKFLIVGGGSSKDIQELKKNILKFKLNDIVYYLGYRTDVLQIVQESDFFILPSITDACPLSVLEAMSLRKPVITTKSGGAAEMIQNNENGFIVPVNDPKRLSEKILQMIEDRDGIMQMGNNAFETFNENFRADIFAKNFERTYTDVLKKKKNSKLSEKELLLLDSFIDHYQDLVNLTCGSDIAKTISSSRIWNILAHFRKIKNKIM